MTHLKQENFKIQLQNIIKEVVENSGFELWGIKYTVEYGKQVIRIYMDSSNGVTIKDCTVVTKLLAPRLDVEDLIPYAYMLEVSSPGLDRPLFTPEQFKKYTGKKIKVKVKYADSKKPKKIKGIIKSTNDNYLVLSDIINENTLHTIKYEDIYSSNLIYDFTNK